MTRADITVSQPGGAARNCGQSTYVVKVSDSVFYMIFIAVNNTLSWYKSVDGGLTWNDPPTIFNGVATGQAIWYDKWTPGNTGTLIHIAFMETTNHDVRYCNLDTSSDTLSTPVVAFNGVSFVAGVNSCLSITRAIGGNLYIAFDGDGGTETGFLRSVDVGVNWTARTDMNEATSDYYLIAPGFNADTQDALVIFWDRSANEISRKIYDDSANSFAETSIATAMNDLGTTTAAPQFALTVNSSTSKILMVAWSDRDLVNSDLRFWTIDETTITEGTNVVLDSVDDQQCCAIALNGSTIYVFYGGKSDGSETAGTSIGIYYKLSTNGGSTWGSETLLSKINKNYNQLMTCPVFSGWFTAAYFSDSTQDAMLLSVQLPGAATNKLGVLAR